MQDFLYCYLSPTLVGLVAFIAVILGIVGVIWFLGWTYTLFSDRVNITLSRKAYEALETTATIALNILVGIFALLLGSLLVYSAWGFGLSLLKRVMCQ